jgi:putative oxidoreductase
MSEQTISAATTSDAGHGEKPGRAVGAMLWVAQVLIAVAFLAASYPKVTLDPMAVEGFATMGFSAAGTLIIGCLEVAGAIGLLVPRLTGLAALGVVALMIGATVATTLTMGVLPALMPAVLGVISALVARGRWYQTVEHISSVRAFATAR